jgi:hypothetical protein
MTYTRQSLFKRSVARYRRLGRDREADVLETLGVERASLLRRVLGRTFLQAVTRG